MSRPTRYCKKCGEYVKEDTVVNPTTLEVQKKLIHISADGNRIHRNHEPIEDI